MNITDNTAVFEVNYVKATFRGMVIPFSGTFSTDGYPIDAATNITRKDWHMCDGTNGTPDLRGRFILGANTDHAIGTSGGEETHTLTVDEMPSHTHNFRSQNDDMNASGVSDTNTNGHHYRGFADDSTESWLTFNDMVLAAGGSKAHNNMPPYYTLSYIMKL